MESEIRLKSDEVRPVDCRHIEPLGRNGNGRMEWYCLLLANSYQEDQPEVVKKEGCAKKGCYLFDRFLERARRVWGKGFSF